MAIQQETTATSSRNSATRYLLTLCLGLGIIFCATAGFGQCDMKFDYSVKNVTKDKGNIYLSLTGKEGAYVFKLYDLYGKQYEFMATREIKSMRQHNKVLVFENLPASTYLIQAISGECKWTIGGLEGIVINKQ